MLRRASKTDRSLLTVTNLIASTADLHGQAGHQGHPVLCRKKSQVFASISGLYSNSFTLMNCLS
ncbi:MAG: hypothetical protein ACJAVR_001654 [Paracoccaceae bacterium]|jgi:hypothetical protein